MGNTISRLLYNTALSPHTMTIPLYGIHHYDIYINSPSFQLRDHSPSPALLTLYTHPTYINLSVPQVAYTLSTIN